MTIDDVIHLDGFDWYRWAWFRWFYWHGVWLIRWVFYVFVRVAPGGSFGLVAARNSEVYWGLIPASRILVTEVVHIQCLKQFKGLECALLSTVLCTIKNPFSLSIRVGHGPDFGLPSVAILPWFCGKRHKTIFFLKIIVSSIGSVDKNKLLVI